MKFILLMFTGSHKKQETARKWHLFQITVRSNWRTTSKSVWSMMMNTSSVQSNFNIFGIPEEIHLVKGNKTDMRYPYCKASPISINPETCPTLLKQNLSKFFPVFSSAPSVYGAWDLPMSSPLWYKLSEEWTHSRIWWEIGNHAVWTRVMIFTVKALVWLEVSRKKKSVSCCTGFLTSVAGC